MDSARKMTAVSLVAAALVLLGRANGQSAVPLQPLQPAQKVATANAGPDLPAQVFAGEPGDAGKPGATDPKKQERLQKIQQLTFDRRPSAILKAWATPREVALEEPKDQPAANPQAAIAPPGRVLRRAGPGGVVVQ